MVSVLESQGLGASRTPTVRETVLGEARAEELME